MHTDKNVSEARSWCVRVWTQTIERFRCERVFREGAENCTRGGGAPRTFLRSTFLVNRMDK